MAATLLVCKSSPLPVPLSPFWPYSWCCCRCYLDTVCLPAIRFALAFRFISAIFTINAIDLPASLPPLPALYWVQKCLIGSGHNFSIRINYVRRQRKMQQVQPGDVADKCNFQSSPVSPPPPPHKHSGWSPNGTCNYYANYNCNFLCTAWSGEGDKEETENGKICEFNLWLNCHEQNWVRACLSFSSVSPDCLPGPTSAINNSLHTFGCWHKKQSATCNALWSTQILN